MNKKTVLKIVAVSVAGVIVAVLSMYLLLKEYYYPFGNYTDVTLSGQVIDVCTKRPLSGATVYISYVVKTGADKYDPVDFRYLTDENGTFVHRARLIGENVSLTVRKTAYRSGQVNIRKSDLNDGGDIRRIVALEKEPCGKI